MPVQDFYASARDQGHCNKRVSLVFYKSITLGGFTVLLPTTSIMVYSQTERSFPQLSDWKNYGSSVNCTVQEFYEFAWAKWHCKKRVILVFYKSITLGGFTVLLPTTSIMVYSQQSAPFLIFPHLNLTHTSLETRPTIEQAKKILLHAF